MWRKFILACACAMAFTEVHGEPQVDAAAAVLEQCDEFSQAGFRECLQRKVRNSLKSLARAEARAAISVERWDEDEQYIARARSRLRASKNAFVKYRDAQCAFATSLGGGAIGAALEMRRLACVYGLNTERTVALKRLTETMPLE
ncbi:lysozyme inhibitor LprI family protein [Pseudoduganella albidiflava]|uniref:DUF1311 domain-containing protein n=1 Tax=Pseudoduganella albidiflava TaxID=321983 RepID=A0A411X6H4_9BURK|nr:lysozyme inhibitor LprI family protein [Pseudoduganella albidiflava]QBI04468.1 DUF1311 domain-containing protein [Pseudoduganella albidiflava]GGY27500.1 hypothetical protein GCM10007387_06950 [Pseudoduganella albidiflava]